MKQIKQISEIICEEIDDAENYARLASEYKEKDPKTASLFYQLSEEELGHMKRLHEAVAAMITRYREEHGEPPEAMMAVYEYLHKRDIERVEKVRILQSVYREN